MNRSSWHKALVWMLCLGCWLVVPASTAAGKTRCTTEIPLCRSLAPHFVDADNPLRYLSIAGQKPLSNDYDAVLLAYSKPRTQSSPGSIKIGIFVVHSTTMKPYMTVAMFPGNFWQITRVSQDSIVLTQYGDYGDIYKKVKYFFDLPSKKVFAPQELKEVMVHRANVFKGELVMTGTTTSRTRQERSVIIRLSDRETPKGPFIHQLVREVKGLPLEPILAVRKENSSLQFMAKPFQYTFSDAGWEKTAVADTRKSVKALGFPKLRDSIPLAVVKENLLVRSGKGNQERRFLVWNQNLNSGFSTGVKVWNQGAVEFYPLVLPQPSDEWFKKFRLKSLSKNSKDHMFSRIGPSQFHKGNIWFGLFFPELWGESGIGGYGYFDTESLQYSVHYRPEWADWAASAFSVKGNTMWVGLYYQGDITTGSGGAVRYDLHTGGSLHIAIPEMVHVIQEWQGAVFFGTANGVWILDDEQLTQGYFTVDQQGVYQLEWDTPITVNELKAKARTK